MELHLWIAFVGASAALLAVPGPVVMLLLGYTLGYGRKAAAAAVPGVLLGDFTAMTVSLLGAGAVLSASASLFMILKLAGAGYLVWLGIKLWRSDATATAKSTQGYSRKKAFCDAFMVTALNPKDIVFFVAFLPQFISASQPILPQIVVIEATFLGLIVISNAAWILLGGTLSHHLRNPRHIRVAHRFGAGWLVGAGALTALTR
ncbi:LysE family translocator [Pelagibius sp. CAU 1746]|uniref:LysE family translocator n=1 Tax=Pelagibius sp. CAU 1746 TaxID=3140370 RepID=UPI00325C1C2E